MGNIFAIGDIHGCLRPLEDLLEKLPVNWSEDYLVFLGDYIDRGPDSRLVLETLMALKEAHPERVVCLLGNHEWMLLRYLQGYDRDIYLLNGGDTTLAQFMKNNRGGDRPPGLSPYRQSSLTGNLGTTLAQFMKDGIVELPPKHLSFLRSLLPYWETERYIFVHAGLRPKIPLAEQRLEDLLFIRGEFIHSGYDWGKRVIFAHTPFPRPLVTPTKIGIDTGCVYGGELTALVLPEVDFYFSYCGR